MSKPKTQPVQAPGEQHPEREHQENHQPEPLSGSKTVKNRNHSNRRYGEGS